nr:uncharacterized protein LOC115114745 isoform X2 [Oncorhynchus nerka]
MMMRMKLTFLLAILLFQLTISVKGGASASKPAQQADTQNPPSGSRNSAPAALSSASLFTFGDIIRTKMKWRDMTYLSKSKKREIPPGYHFAIWVGNPPTNVVMPNRNTHNIFHFDGKKLNCTYADIGDINEWQQYNVRDNKPGFVPQQPEQIARDLEERYHNCGDYSVLRNNCEHLVTWLRYHNKVSKQDGAVGMFLRFFRPAEWPAALPPVNEPTA